MPVTVSWYKQHEVILARFTEDILVDDLGPVITGIVEHLQDVRDMNPDAGYYRTHIIIDTWKTTKLHFNLIEFVGYLKKNDFERNPDHIGFLIIVNQSEGYGKIIRFFLSVAFKLYDLRFRYTSTLDEAQHIIEQLDHEFYATFE